MYEFLGVGILVSLTFQTFIVTKQIGAHFLDVFYF